MRRLWSALAAMALAAALLAALLAGCGPPDPAPLTRVAGWTPRGAEVPVDAPLAIDLSGPLDPAGVTDGRRVAACRAADARDVARAAESAAGLSDGAPIVPAAVALLDGGRRVALAPRAPLAPGTAYALVLGPVRDAAGHPVLDPDGRHRTFVATFETVKPPPGPPPLPVLTEVRAVAATPEAGGEYVEVQDRGEGPLDLAGWRLEKRTAAGAWSGCFLSLAEGGPAPPGGFALVTGAAWDGRYAVPPDTPRFACGGATLAGGLADDRPPEVRLVDPDGAVRSTLGTGGAPACPGAVARLDPAGPDAASNLGCLDPGTPGW